MGFRETIADDEARRFETYGAELRALQRRRAALPGAAAGARALHAKQHVGATGEVVVAAELPPALAPASGAGPFTPGARFAAYVRFSNGAGVRQPDGMADVRGVALKLVGVPGRKVIPGLEDEKTQDFLFIQTPSIAFRDPDEFMRFVRAAARGPAALLVPRLLGAFGLGRGLTILKTLAATPKVRSMATTTFFTAAPLTFGPSAAKLALFPSAEGAPEANGGGGPGGSAAGALRADLVRRLQAGPITYSLRAQLFVDDVTTPIEDTSVRWPEAQSPFVEIARVTLPRQDVESARGQEIERDVEAMSFDPWHAVEGLRPLGAIMRARAVAYRESVLERGAAPEPETVPESV